MVRPAANLAIDAATRKAQADASNPRASAWVSANAGSGKTHVLAQRVIRLLLDGVEPAKILCLTFTKAAAANMANRVFGTLASWTALDDDALGEAIRRIEGRPPSAQRRTHAPATSCATRNGTPSRTSHSATSVARLKPWGASSAIRGTL